MQTLPFVSPSLREDSEVILGIFRTSPTKKKDPKFLDQARIQLEGGGPAKTWKAECDKEQVHLHDFCQLQAEVNRHLGVSQSALASK